MTWAEEHLETRRRVKWDKPRRRMVIGLDFVSAF